MVKEFTVCLGHQLALLIKDSISIHVYKDTLIIDIISSGSPLFHYTLGHLRCKIVMGLSSEKLAYDIAKKYKTQIISKHFFTK